MSNKNFVMVDGLDGAGKGVVVDALHDWAKSKKLKVLDLKSYWKDSDDIPDFESVSEYEVIISAEPTYALVGKGIRQEIIKKNEREYSAHSTAFAFSLDREILYRKLLIPALKAGKLIFQERGITTSLIYQPVQGNISMNEILALPGNKLAMQHSPGLVLIPKVTAQTSIVRLKNRSKKDDAIFENLKFQEKIRERFESEWFRTLLENHGSKVEYIENDMLTEKEFREKIIGLWNGFHG